jgi:hypothetical protein
VSENWAMYQASFAALDSAKASTDEHFAKVTPAKVGTTLEASAGL